MDWIMITTPFVIVVVSGSFNRPNETRIDILSEYSLLQ